MSLTLNPLRCFQTWDWRVSAVALKALRLLEVSRTFVATRECVEPFDFGMIFWVVWLVSDRMNAVVKSVALSHCFVGRVLLCDFPGVRFHRCLFVLRISPRARGWKECFHESVCVGKATVMLHNLVFVEQMLVEVMQMQTISYDSFVVQQPVPNCKDVSLAS